ncbi:MAG: MbnP family protein [Saprospiraceae bacterium]
MSAYLPTSLFVFSLLLLTTSCRNTAPIFEETTTVELNYRATFGEEPLVMGQWFPYDSAVQVRFTNFDFYISDLTLLQELSPNGLGAEIKEIALLDFSKIATSPAALAGIDSRIDNVPIDAYEGLRLGIGVPSDLNRTRPIEYAPDHPLRRDDLYQSEWESYIFAVINGTYDTNNDGVADGEFNYEIGTDNFYQKVAIMQGVDVVVDNTAPLNFTIDVYELLGGNTQPIDVVGQPTDENLKLAERISENFEVALTLE